MKKRLYFLLLILALVGTFFSCNNKGGDIPEGLQICYEGKAEGYIFYAPENWTIVNSGDVKAARLSNTNNTSISFTKSKMPEVSIPEYFEGSLSQFPEEMRLGMNIITRDKECSFGNASEKAYKYVYTYKYKDVDYACMQILTVNNGEFYIFTYTSHGDVNSDTSDYQQYLEPVQLAIDNFKFTEKSDAEDKVVYEKDSDGYNLVSDKKLSGFSLYLPEEYEVIYSDGFVKAKISSAANISLSKATETNVGILDYLKARREGILGFADEITDIRICLATDVNYESEIYKDFAFDVLPEKDESLCFGNLEKNKIVSYEYKYTFNGQVYHVYQLAGVNDRNGYIFTYTALEDEYNLHIGEIKSVISQVTFS